MCGQARVYLREEKEILSVIRQLLEGKSHIYWECFFMPSQEILPR